MRSYAMGFCWWAYTDNGGDCNKLSTSLILRRTMADARFFLGEGGVSKKKTDAFHRPKYGG